MEKITVFMERVMTKKFWLVVLGLIAIIAPLYFLKTLYEVWFGSYDVFLGFKLERTTFLVMAIVDTVGFLTTLPARKNGRIIQVVMGLWSIEMYLLYIGTFIR